MEELRHVRTHVSMAILAILVAQKAKKLIFKNVTSKLVQVSEDIIERFYASFFLTLILKGVPYFVRLGISEIKVVLEISRKN